MDAINFVVPVV